MNPAKIQAMRDLGADVRLHGRDFDETRLETPAMWHAWKNHSLDEYPTMKTEHEGLATRVPFEMPLKTFWQLLDEFLLVTDEEINDAIRLLAINAK